MSRVTATKTKTAEMVVYAIERELGICSTCINVQGCTFRRGVHEAIWDCDEFSAQEAPSAVPRPAPKAVPIKTATNGNGNGAAAGLCYDCEHKTDCVFRRPGVPVLDCEEYR